MRLILYSWNANNEQVLADNLFHMGFEVIWLRKECRHYTRDMDLAMEMIQQIHAKKAEAVVSFNYFPIISMVCHTCQIPYYAWVYDCPHFTLYAKQVNDPCNHIGVFDREMARQLGNYGINTVYHAPLSVDTEYFGQIIRRTPVKERDKYRCDISFVGSLYTNEHNYYDSKIMNEADYSSMDAVIGKQCFSYQEDYLRQAVTDGVLDMPALQTRMEQEGLMLGEDYSVRAEDILLPAVLEKKVTVEERRRLLTSIGSWNGLTGREYDFRLYTGSDTGGLPEINRYNQGMVDYHTQMPLVFAGSRINLNISLRSIHSGIPLRVLDIMACGGFVLTNWQPEIAEHFEEGVEAATYSSLEECLDKVHYYLAHEEGRSKIAAAGQRKVKEVFSYQSGLVKLLEI